MLAAMTTKLLAALAAALLMLTACGGNGDDEEAAQAISDTLMKQQDGAAAGLAMKQEQADCIGDGWVDKIGTEKLQEYGVLTEDLKADETINDVKLSADDAEAAVDTVFDCADVKKMLTNADKLHTTLELMFRGKQDEANQQMVEPMMKCAAGGQ
jgi:hypothetical protein